jgi:hypothetical protein
LPRSNGDDTGQDEHQLVPNFVVEDPHKWWSKYIIVIGDKHGDGGGGALSARKAAAVSTPPRSSESRSSTQSSQARRAARKRNAQEDLERELEARYAKAQAHTVPRLLRASKAGGRSCFVKLNNDTEHRLERRRYDSPAGRWTPECEPPETIYKGERDVPFGTESSGFMSGTSGMVVYGLQHERFGNLRCAPWRSSSFETSYL